MLLAFRHCFSAGLIAVGLAAFSSWVAVPNGRRRVAAVPLFFLSAAGSSALALAFQPAIEVYEHHLAVGRK